MTDRERHQDGPTTVDLPPELREVQARWLTAGRAEQERIYAAEFGPAFAPLFAKLPLHGAPPSFERPTVLISLLGFSWQPVALLAAWVKPRHMLVVGTRESLAQCPGGEPVVRLIGRVAQLEREIEARAVSDAGETEIYREVLAFLERHGVDRRNATNVAVDPTGGKKSMSVAAGLAAYLANARMLYVDYAEYDTAKRIPVASTEYPRLLANPLEVFGDLEIERVREAFNRGDYSEAHRLAVELERRLYEPREASALGRLSAGYDAWARFDFREAVRPLRAARGLLEQFATRGRWQWAQGLAECVARHEEAVARLEAVPDKAETLDAGLPIVENHLAAAQRALDSARTSQALMYTYAAVERYVDLCLWVRYRLDDERPDYDSTGVRQQLDRAAYDRFGRELLGPGYEERELPPQLTYSNGLQLLGALEAALVHREDVPDLAALGQTRNRCEFEHGFKPKIPAPEDVKKYIARAKTIVERQCPNLRERLQALRFPKL